MDVVFGVSGERVISFFVGGEKLAGARDCDAGIGCVGFGVATGACKVRVGVGFKFGVGGSNFGSAFGGAGFACETVLVEEILGKAGTPPSALMPHCKAIWVCSLCPCKYCSWILSVSCWW